MSDKTKGNVLFAVHLLSLLLIIYIKIIRPCDIEYVKALYSDLPLASVVLWDMFNYVPFKFITDPASYSSQYWIAKVIFNLLLYFLPSFTFVDQPENGKAPSFIKHMLSIGVIALAIETVSWSLFCGAFYIDNFILNMIGATTAFFISRKVIKYE